MVTKTPFGFSIRASKRKGAGFVYEIQAVVNLPRACFFAMRDEAMKGVENNEKTILFKITCEDDIEFFFDAITTLHARCPFEINFDALGPILVKVGKTGENKVAATTALLPWWKAACTSSRNFMSAFDMMPLWEKRIEPLVEPTRIEALRAFLLLVDETKRAAAVVVAAEVDDEEDEPIIRSAKKRRCQARTPPRKEAAAEAADDDDDDEADAEATDEDGGGGSNAAAAAEKTPPPAIKLRPELTAAPERPQKRTHPLGKSARVDDGAVDDGGADD